MKLRPDGRNLDRVASVASALCAIHCFLVAVALGAVSLVGFGWFENVLVDVAFLGIALGVGGLAAYRGFARHGNARVMALYGLGLGLLLLANALALGGVGGAGTLHALLAVAGGVTLVVFHVLNMRVRRPCEFCALGTCEVEAPEPAHTGIAQRREA